MITKGRIPYSILHLPTRSIYKQVDATDNEMMEKIRESKKKYLRVETEYCCGKTIITAWRK